VDPLHFRQRTHTYL